MGQRLTIFRNRNSNGQTKGVFIAKSSIGIITINGVKYTYHEELIESNRIDFQQRVEDMANGVDTKTAKKKIYIRKR